MEMWDYCIFFLTSCSVTLKLLATFFTTNATLYHLSDHKQYSNAREAVHLDIYSSLLIQHTNNSLFEWTALTLCSLSYTVTRQKEQTGAWNIHLSKANHIKQ